MKRDRERRTGVEVVADTAAVAVDIAAVVAGMAVATTEREFAMDRGDTQRTDSGSRGLLLDRIERVLEDQVRPDLRADGGDIVLAGIDADNIVQVRLTGACQGCSSSVYTLSMRVEAILKAEIPEIRFLEAVP
jgi:Fe-S cluster biogenesis protein NfuA